MGEPSSGPSRRGAQEHQGVLRLLQVHPSTVSRGFSTYPGLYAWTVIEKKGGFGFIDKNTVVVGKLKDLEEDDLGDEDDFDYRNVESLEDHLCSNMGWELFFKSSFLPVVVLRMPNLIDDFGHIFCFRLLFLYTPFCNATFWNPKNTKVSLKRIWSMARTIMQCQVSLVESTNCLFVSRLA